MELFFFLTKMQKPLSQPKKARSWNPYLKKLLNERIKEKTKLVTSISAELTCYTVFGSSGLKTIFAFAGGYGIGVFDNFLAK